MIVKQLQMEATIAEEFAADLMFQKLLMAGKPSGNSEMDKERLKRLEKEVALNNAHIKKKINQAALRFQNLEKTTMAKHKLTKTSSFTKRPKNRPFLRKTTSFAPKSRHSSSNPSNVSTWNVIVQTKLDDSLPCTLLQIDPNQDTRILFFNLLV